MGFLTDWLGRRVSEAELDAVTSKLKDIVFYKELALYIAKSYIANTISKCEFLVYENGREVRNELYYALNVSPNPNQSSSQFLNKLINTLYEKNEVLVVPKGAELYIADSFLQEEKPLRENVFSNICIDDKAIGKSYKASQVFYFKLDDKKVSGLIEGLYGTYGQLMSCAIAAYKRSNGQKYKLVIDGMKAGDQKFAEQFNTTIKQQLQSFIENENAVYPQFRGTDLQTIGTAATGTSSSDVVALRKEIFDIAAQAFKIPNSMMYGNITNMGEIVKVYLSFCIDPLADMLSEELTRKTNTFETWNGGKNCVVCDTSMINHIDILDVADKADKLIASGVCNIDEVRRVLSMRPLDTEFSQRHYITKNYANVDEVLSGEVSG